MKVENMTNDSGRAIPNQFIISGVEYSEKHKGNITVEVFQSYASIIVKKEYCTNGRTLIDADKWDYSTTTGKYRNLFLHEKKKETEKKIKSGEYTLANLN